MTVKELSDACGFMPICLPDPDREIDGAYVGDLLSWVMGRARSANVWITIMSNVNIVAVGVLADVSCILLTEGVMPDDDARSAAEKKGVNILSTNLSSFYASKMISEHFK